MMMETGIGVLDGCILINCFLLNCNRNKNPIWMREAERNKIASKYGNNEITFYACERLGAIKSDLIKSLVKALSLSLNSLLQSFTSRIFVSPYFCSIFRYSIKLPSFRIFSMAIFSANLKVNVLLSNASNGLGTVYGGLFMLNC